jgi:predicted unusual protein kinase regulating ubiquinone biosynthesis (AarF/ABC1/UbiB family)
MERIIKEVFTISNICWIIFSETAFYFMFNDYSNYVRRLANSLSRVNILYVKVFQAIASNHSWIDDKTNNELLKFTDHAPWTYDDIDFYELIEVSDKYDLYFKEGYETPINSGMISIVFKAYKNSDNLPVIIKMKRNDIKFKLNNSIENLKTLLYFLSFIPIFNKYKIAEVVDKNIEMIRHQLNFEEEVQNILRVKENCKHLKYVKIPDVSEKVTKSYPNFIIMEYIHGIKIHDLIEEDYIPFAKQVLKFGLVTTIVHGLSHGDLHSGNILFIKDDNDEKYPHKIGVIDFGIIFELDTQYKNTLFELFTQIFERPPRESIVQFLNSVIIENHDIIKQIPEQDYEKIVQVGIDIFEQTLHQSQNVNQVQLYKFLSKMYEYLSKKEIANLGIKPSDQFIKTQMVLAMAHGVTLSLCKENFLSIMDNVLNELFHTHLLLNPPLEKVEPNNNKNTTKIVSLAPPFLKVD